jgi:membrane-bound lytic murein transglycosylase D
LLKNPAAHFLALLCLSGCAGTSPDNRGASSAAPASSAPSMKPGEPALEPAEKMLFAEVDEFVGLGHDALRDSLWFQAAEDFDSALVRLSALESGDSLSPGVVAHVSVYRDSVQKLLVGAVAMTTQASGTVPWSRQFDEEMEEVADSVVLEMDSITHHLDPRRYDLPLPSPLNERILQAVAVFVGPGRGYFTKWLTRKSRYEQLVIPRLEARGMPKDLIYLAMVESGFNPKAWSKAAASGMWQFISGTGRRYGLKDDWWYDPRRDPVLATEAALDYLEDLHGEFGDWHQAMAGYNCGEGRIRRFRNADSTMSYWDMPLPKETQFYVPKILAAMIIGHDPERFGFRIESPEPPLAFDTATVTHCLSIATIAKAAEASEDDIIGLNPALRRWCTPPNRPSHVVYLPPGKREVFARNYGALDKSQLVNWHHHIVSRGEYLGAIASRYRVSVAAIKATNKMKGSSIRPGQSLLIPLAPEEARRFAESQPRESRGGGKYAGGTYKVRSGDNLFDIARKFNTTVSRLLKANNLRPGTIIRPGQRLKLGGSGSSSGGDEREFRSEPPNPYADGARKPRRENDAVPEGETRVHLVKAGESVYSIALALGVKQDELMAWNDLDGPDIMAGQRLVYHARAAGGEREGPRTAGRAAASRAKGSSDMGATPAPSAGRRFHRVQPGENLYRIALQHGTDQHSLMELNGLSSTDKIFPGDSLLVSGPGKSQDFGNGGGHREEVQYYTVKSGDNLWDIATRYRSTVQKLKDLNGRMPAVLKPGTRIRVK